MKLITKEIEKKLIEAGPDGEKPIVKFFGGSACTWIITGAEIIDGKLGDILWGFADLGMDCVEFGTISLSELKAIRFRPFGLSIERDMYFDTKKHSFRELLEKETLAGL